MEPQLGCNLGCIILLSLVVLKPKYIACFTLYFAIKRHYSQGIHCPLWHRRLPCDSMLLLSIRAWLIFPHKETLIKSPFLRIEGDASCLYCAWIACILVTLLDGLVLCTSVNPLEICKESDVCNADVVLI